MDNIFELYATKKAEAEKLDEELASLKDLIVGYMNEKDISLHETPWGKFQLQGRASWTYSPAIEEAQNKVKQLKKQEEQDGTATSITLNVLILKK